MSKTAEQIKPELLPVDLGGGDIQFVKRADYCKRTAENFALKLKAEIKKDHVNQCLEHLDNGHEELQGEGNPEELVKLFEAVAEDYRDAVKKVKEEKEKAEADKLAKEKEAKEKAEKEEKLFLAVKDERADLSSLTRDFDTGGAQMNRFIAKGTVTDQQLLQALNTGLGMSEFTNWMIGDLVVTLEDRGQLNVVSRLAENRGVPYSKLYNDAKTARAIKPDDRKPDVSFTIYREIANAKFTKEQEAERVKLIADASEGKYNTQTVREAVRKVQGKTPPPDLLAEEDPKKEFLVVDLNTDDITKGVQTCIGFPKELYGEGAIVIDPKTKQKFVKNGFAKKPENRWEDLPEYEAPKEEPEPTPAPAPSATGAKKGNKKAAAAAK